MNENITQPPYKKVKRLVQSILTITLGVYFGFLILIYIFQARLLFFPTTELAITPKAFQWNYEDVFLTLDNQETTHGWFIPTHKERKGTILLSHGNAGNIADRMDILDIYREMGFDTLIYDYGGYGKSSGSPSEQRSYRDIRAMWLYLIETRGIPQKEIILFGRSLGGGVTVQLATEVTPAAVVLESTFASVPQMAKHQFPIFPTQLLVRHRFDNLNKISRITVPTLHIHSPDDSIIPYEQGRQLYDAAQGPKTFIDLEGDHNEGYYLTGKRYTDGLDAFFSEHLLARPNTISAPESDSPE